MQQEWKGIQLSLEQLSRGGSQRGSVVRGADLLGSWKSSYNLQLTVYPRVLHICRSAPADSTNHRRCIVVFTTEKKKKKNKETAYKWTQIPVGQGSGSYPSLPVSQSSQDLLRVWWEVAALRTAGAGQRVLWTLLFHWFLKGCGFSQAWKSL